jgi:hypothetical protein
VNISANNFWVSEFGGIELCCFRVPNSGLTYEELATKYGTGALNIDSARIGSGAKKCSTLYLLCEIAWSRDYIITRLIPKWVLSHHATLSDRRDPALPPLVELVVFFRPQHRPPPLILVSILRATMKIRIVCTQP